MRVVGLLFAVVVVHHILATVEIGFGINCNRALARPDGAENYGHHSNTNSTFVAAGGAVYKTSFFNSGNYLSSNSSSHQQNSYANSTANDEKRLVPTGSNPLHNR